MPSLLDLNLPHLESAAIVIDALANEPAWDEALVVDDFISYAPVPDSQPLTQATVRLLSDESSLYVHFTVVDPEPDKVNARFSNRDNIWGGDTAGIYVDTAGDGQRAYLFLCNPYGVQTDATRVAGQRDSFSWDGKWYSAGQVTDTGYQIEMAIPWSTMRHPASMDQIGISLLHATYREGQRSGWPRRDPDISGILIQQALMGGPGAVPAGNKAHFIPELTFGLDQDGPSSSRLGFGGLAPGLTVRYDPSPELTLLATANPDFSQVEGDEFQIDVNQRYALYYEEKRPFFLEGQEWLEGNMSQLVYTRSMVMPRVGLRATAEQGDWRTAVMHVVDAAPTGTVNEGRGWSDEDMEGHLALNTIARTRRPLGADGFVGGIFSHKKILNSPMENEVMAMDMRVRITDAVVFDGATGGSLTRLVDGQRITGNAGNFGLEHESKAWEFETGLYWAGSDFRAENGYVTQSNVLGTRLELERKFYPEDSFVQTWDLMANGQFEWQLDGELRRINLNPGLSLRMKKNTWAYVAPQYFGERYEGVFLSGPSAMWFMGSFPSRYWGIILHGRSGEGPYYDSENPRTVKTFYSGAELNLRPTDRLSFSASASFTRLWEETGELDRGLVGRGYMTAFFSNQIWLRAIVDFSSFSDAWGAETLMAWQKSPGTAFYLGGSTNLSDQSWQAFTKLSWAFGL
jgi:hypothetical protein